MGCVYYIIDLAQTPSFGFVFRLVGGGVVPFHPVLVLGTVATLRVVLRSAKVLVVGTVLLSRVCVSATVVGYVGATGEAPVFPLFPHLVMRWFLVIMSCLAFGSYSYEFNPEFLNR